MKEGRRTCLPHERNIKRFTVPLLFMSYIIRTRPPRQGPGRQETGDRRQETGDTRHSLLSVVIEAFLGELSCQMYFDLILNFASNEICK